MVGSMGSFSGFSSIDVSFGRGCSRASVCELFSLQHNKTLNSAFIAIMDIDFTRLLVLLKCTSKAKVKMLLKVAVQAPGDYQFLSQIQQELELNDTEMGELMVALRAFVQSCNQGWPLTFPANYHSQLKELLLKLVDETRSELQRECDLPELPRLKDIDWRVDVRVSSSEVESLPRIPRAIIQLTTTEATHTLELGKESLQAMLEGLGKIKEQLESLT